MVATISDFPQEPRVFPLRTSEISTLNAVLRQIIYVLFIMNYSGYGEVRDRESFRYECCSSSFTRK